MFEKIEKIIYNNNNDDDDDSYSNIWLVDPMDPYENTYKKFILPSIIAKLLPVGNILKLKKYGFFIILNGILNGKFN